MHVRVIGSLLVFDHDEAGRVVGFVGDADMGAASLRCVEPVGQFAVQHDLRLAAGRLTISQARQVIGMRMPRPMALENASLAEKRVAR